MSELKDSVILPREDFLELEAAAFDQHFSGKERVAQTAQPFAVFVGLAAAVTAGAAAVAKVRDWYETRAMNRRQVERLFEIDHPLPKN